MSDKLETFLHHSPMNPFPRQTSEFVWDLSRFGRNFSILQALWKDRWTEHKSPKLICLPGRESDTFSLHEYLGE
jgi:hypothetical protein